MIEGSLRNVPLSDVFQIIATGQKSGILTVMRGKARARIYFEQGRVQYAHISPGVHLGEILVRMDLLTTHEVQEILRRQHVENAGTPLGLMAVEMRLIDEEDLKGALERQVLEVVSELMSWSDGQFNFAERSGWASQAPTNHSVDAMALLMSVAQRLHDFEGGLVDADTIYLRSGDPTKVEMPPGAWEVLGYIDGKRTARSVAAELDLTEKHVFHLMHELVERSVIEAQPFRVEDPLVLAVSPSSALQRLLRLSLQRARLRAEVALDYDDALKILPGMHPSALVVDDEEGAGWALVKELRKQAGQSHLPVLMLVDEEPKGGIFGRARRPRAEVLLKPFHEIEFQQIITRMVGRPLA
ncbi:MAG TPA: DUF4388 domain-containing protein [Trueperaceae bacterium]|nr:DUF4388 domain-containing protein [Trueperaceae bacterium]